MALTFREFLLGELNETSHIREGYDYDDAVTLDDISPKEARREIEAHSLRWEDFIEEVGDKPEYTGKEILDWLGY